MAWTQAEIEKIRCAILKKATGERLTSVDLGGRLESYADAPLDQLRALLEEIEAEVEAASGTQRSRVFRTRYNKGL
jgi:phage baseplate assembly protein W